MHTLTSFFLLRFSVVPCSSVSTPPLCRHGEGQDGGARTRKEDEGVAKGKKQQDESSSRAGLPQGWIQGDWIQSLIWHADLDELAESGLIAKGAARLPEGEMSP